MLHDKKVQRCWKKSDKLVGKRDNGVKDVFTIINREKTYVEEEIKNLETTAWWRPRRRSNSKETPSRDGPGGHQGVTGVKCSRGLGADNDGYDSEGPAVDDLDSGGDRDHVSKGDLVSGGDLDSESDLDSEGPAGRDNNDNARPSEKAMAEMAVQ